LSITLIDRPLINANGINTKTRSPAINDEKDTKARTATLDHAKEIQEIMNYA
jgi:hypothetical protein